MCDVIQINNADTCGHNADAMRTHTDTTQRCGHIRTITTQLQTWTLNQKNSQIMWLERNYRPNYSGSSTTRPPHRFEIEHPPKQSSQQQYPSSTSGSTAKEGEGGLLNTLPGVILPSLPSLVGVLLFLRLPHITSEAGCIYTSLLILL